MSYMSIDDFEARYRADPDPWSYESSDYERGKYAATLKEAVPAGCQRLGTRRFGGRIHGAVGAALPFADDRGRGPHCGRDRTTAACRLPACDGVARPDTGRDPAGGLRPGDRVGDPVLPRP